MKVNPVDSKIPDPDDIPEKKLSEEALISDIRNYIHQVNNRTFVISGQIQLFLEEIEDEGQKNHWNEYYLLLKDIGIKLKTLNTMIARPFSK
ncbi:hypothetical protein JW979_12390 [bacterium]|nr:hypothetical protein [candidate division CSSED10-310 bacterium]